MRGRSGTLRARKNLIVLAGPEGAVSGRRAGRRHAGVTGAAEAEPGAERVDAILVDAIIRQVGGWDRGDQLERRGAAPLGARRCGGRQGRDGGSKGDQGDPHGRVSVRARRPLSPQTASYRSLAAVPQGEPRAPRRNAIRSGWLVVA